VQTAPDIPVHVAKSTNTMKRVKATGMNARPPRNSAIPAAADPAKPLKKHVTVAVMAHGAIKPIFLLF
jgi:hypothetical protein